MISHCCQSSSSFVIQVACLEDGGNMCIVTTLQSIIYPCQSIWSLKEKHFLLLHLVSCALYHIISSYFAINHLPGCVEKQWKVSRSRGLQCRTLEYISTQLTPALLSRTAHTAQMCSWIKTTQALIFGVKVWCWEMFEACISASTFNYWMRSCSVYTIYVVCGNVHAPPSFSVLESICMELHFHMWAPWLPSRWKYAHCVCFTRISSSCNEGSGIAVDFG